MYYPERKITLIDTTGCNLPDFNLKTATLWEKEKKLEELIHGWAPSMSTMNQAPRLIGSDFSFIFLNTDVHNHAGLHCMIRHANRDPLYAPLPDYSPCRIKAGSSFSYEFEINHQKPGPGRTIFSQLHNDIPGTTFFIMSSFPDRTQYSLEGGTVTNKDKLNPGTWTKYSIHVTPNKIICFRDNFKEYEHSGVLPTANGILCRAPNFGLYAVWAKDKPVITEHEHVLIRNIKIEMYI